MGKCATEKKIRKSSFFRHAAVFLTKNLRFAENKNHCRYEILVNTKKFRLDVTI